jgi:hypothetical protein
MYIHESKQKEFWHPKLELYLLPRLFNKPITGLWPTVIQYLEEPQHALLDAVAG